MQHTVAAMDKRRCLASTRRSRTCPAILIPQRAISGRDEPPHFDVSGSVAMCYRRENRPATVSGPLTTVALCAILPHESGFRANHCYAP
jgi:hypothetical protein